MWWWRVTHLWPLSGSWSPSCHWRYHRCPPCSNTVRYPSASHWGCPGPFVHLGHLPLAGTGLRPALVALVRVRSQGFAYTVVGTLACINSSTSEELCVSLYLSFHDLGDDSIFVCLHQDVVAPEGPAATTPADPTQTKTLHRVLTGQRGHAPLCHFKTGNRWKVSTCSTDAHLKHLYWKSPCDS